MIIIAAVVVAAAPANPQLQELLSDYVARGTDDD